MELFFGSGAVPEPKSFLDLWIAVGFIVSIGANLFTMLRVNRSQKREVAFTFEPASKEEFEKHLAEDSQVHRDLFSKIGGVERGLSARFMELPDLERRIDAKNESRSEKLHNRVNEVLAAVSELRGLIAKK